MLDSSQATPEPNSSTTVGGPGHADVAPAAKVAVRRHERGHPPACTSCCTPEAVVSVALAPEALAWAAPPSEERRSEAVASEALAPKARAPEALVSEALIPDALVSEGPAPEALSSESGAPEALASEPLREAERLTPAAESSAPTPPSPFTATPFAAFVTASRRSKPTSLTLGCWSLAGVAHVAFFAWVACNAFWAVEELAPSQVKVSLRMWSEARPATPPAGAVQAAARPREPKHAAKSTPRGPQLTQPTAVPTSAPVPAETPQVAAEAPATEPAQANAEAATVASGSGEAAEGTRGSQASTATVAAPTLPPALSAGEREGLTGRYVTDVLDKRIKQHLFYPHEAEEEELEGVVSVSLVINDRGQLISARVVKGAELGSLSEAALQTVHRAQPFPPPPPSLGKLVEVRVHLKYRLEG